MDSVTTTASDDIVTTTSQLTISPTGLSQGDIDLIQNARAPVIPLSTIHVSATRSIPPSTGPSVSVPQIAPPVNAPSIPPSTGPSISVPQSVPPANAFSVTQSRPRLEMFVSSNKPRCQYWIEKQCRQCEKQQNKAYAAYNIPYCADHYITEQEKLDRKKADELEQQNKALESIVNAKKRKAEYVQKRIEELNKIEESSAEVHRKIARNRSNYENVHTVTNRILHETIQSHNQNPQPPNTSATNN